MQTPYLIQRCEIVRPLTEGRFSQVAKTDYMGSAEFEFGALPQSLRALQARIGDIKLSVDNRILDGEKSIRILHTFDEDEFEQYFEYLQQMREGKLRLKESSRFEADRASSKWDRTDLWWDIDNHVMWSFDKIFMNRLGDSLVASWKYMDEQKAQREQQ